MLETKTSYHCMCDVCAHPISNSLCDCFWETVRESLICTSLGYVFEQGDQIGYICDQHESPFGILALLCTNFSDIMLIDLYIDLLYSR